MARQKSINKQKIPKNKNRLKVNEQIPNYDDMPPIFSLEKVIGDDYCFTKLDDTNKKQFAESIYKRRDIKWSEIKKINKHKLGTEQIPKHQIKGKMPNNIKDDTNYFLAFRYNGKKSMVGYRDKNIFYIIWFDHNFTLYDH